MLCQIVYIISAFPSLNPDPCDDCDEEKEWGMQSTFILVSSIFCLKAEILQGSLIFFPYVKDIKNLIKSFVPMFLREEVKKIVNRDNLLSFIKKDSKKFVKST